MFNSYNEVYLFLFFIVVSSMDTKSINTFLLIFLLETQYKI